MLHPAVFAARRLLMHAVLSNERGVFMLDYDKRNDCALVVYHGWNNLDAITQFLLGSRYDILTSIEHVKLTERVIGGAVAWAQSAGYDIEPLRWWAEGTFEGIEYRRVVDDEIPF